MSDLIVRDHRQPCEHSTAVREEGHESAPGPYYCLKPWCPGGRKITLRATVMEGIAYADAFGSTVYVLEEA